ncbi:hypothetical protein BH24ACT15_BH24ACT15_35700 [soil metagenome]
MTDTYITRFRKTAGVLTAAAFVMSLVVLAPTPAAARHINCGVITEDTTLTEDVTECPGYGLIIRADNITLNLNRHTVSCDNTFPEQVGILLDGVSGVTVTNGTVEGCDAGVSIEGGGGNTVRHILARDNVNDMEEPFDPTGPPPEGSTLADILCDYGDGILTFNSGNNLIERNHVYGNGPYSGISLVEEGSDGNIVRDNRVENNDLLNYRPGTEVVNPETGAVTGQTSLCGATLPGEPGMQRGRNNQDIGIRIEGPGADNNHVGSNQVHESALAGISVHSHVCNPRPGDSRGVTDPNVNNRIDRNTVTGTGNDTFATDPTADGIGLLAQGPIGNVTCGSNDNTVTNNRSNDNRRHGILVNVDNTDNTIRRNQVNNNDRDGIFVATHGTVPASRNLLQENRGTGNGEHDGHDANPNCDANRWIANQFATINQSCVGGGGTVVAAAGGASATASVAAADEDSGNVNRGPRSS